MRRKFIHYLPDHIRRELDQKLIENNFTNYREIETWYEQRLERALEAGEITSLKDVDVNFRNINKYAREELQPIVERNYELMLLADTYGEELRQKFNNDDNFNLSDLLSSLGQQAALEELLTIIKIQRERKENGEEKSNVSLSQLLKAISELNKSILYQKKYKRQIKEIFKELEKETKHIDQTGKPVIDPNTLKVVREQVYGIFE